MFYFVPYMMIFSPLTVLLLAALIPPIFLLVKVYKLDRIEPEPRGLVLKLFLLGALSTIPAGWLEAVLEANVIKPIFGSGPRLVENFFMFFCVVAVVEEGLKNICLKKGSWNHPAFDYQFDAIVYSVAVTLGFAAAENIGYVMSYGLGNALVRAVTSIPGHCIFGIFMGHYYGLAKRAENRGRRGLRGTYRFLSFFIPVLLHGFYDFTAVAQSGLLAFLFLVYILVMDILAFRAVNRYAREDAHL